MQLAPEHARVALRYAPRAVGKGGTSSSCVTLLLLMLLPSSPNPPLTLLATLEPAPGAAPPAVDDESLERVERELPGRREGGGPSGTTGVLLPLLLLAVPAARAPTLPVPLTLVLDAALPLRPCTLRDKPATGGAPLVPLTDLRCAAPPPGPRDLPRPSAEPGRVLARVLVPEPEPEVRPCVGVGEREGRLEGGAGETGRDDEVERWLIRLEGRGGAASDERRYDEREGGRDDSRCASGPAPAPPSRLGGRMLPAPAAPLSPRIVELRAMPPAATPPGAVAAVGEPILGMALPRMTLVRRWSSRFVRARTRVVICCMSRIMVAVSVRGMPRAGLCGRRETAAALDGDERTGVEGEHVRPPPPPPPRARCAVRVERASEGAPWTSGARNGAGLEGMAEYEVERAILEGEGEAKVAVGAGAAAAAAAEGRMREESRGVGSESSVEGEGESGGGGEGARGGGRSSPRASALEVGKGDGDSGSTGVVGAVEGAGGGGGTAASWVLVKESSSLTSA